MNDRVKTPCENGSNEEGRTGSIEGERRGKKKLRKERSR